MDNERFGRQINILDKSANAEMRNFSESHESREMITVKTVDWVTLNQYLQKICSPCLSLVIQTYYGELLTP